jgi:uridine kinase/ribulose-5-phosphate 4-epimerase/fuculose-1-phosphate aldolase
MITVICISGSSGVGKTTLSRLVCSVLGEDRCICLSGDDLHKWERNSEEWNTITHLNPNANELKLGSQHMLSLLNGIPISRKLYNHDNGKFDSVKIIHPKEFIIYEGLHALYLKETRDISTINIFVDTDDDLKKYWKVKRDTINRGYTNAEVVEIMARRKKDEECYITPQKEYADIVVKFSKNLEKSNISLDYMSVTDRGEDILATVKDLYDSMNYFIEGCMKVSVDNSLTQERGGNISIKSKGGLIVKASGYKMSDVNFYHGFCVCDIMGSVPIFDSESDYRNYIISSKKFGKGNPSMEVGFHMNMADKVIIHTHPLHLNALLCSKEGNDIIRELFSDLSYEYIEYTIPGMNLCNRLANLNEKHIIFLENHGLIVGSETMNDGIVVTEEINNRCKKWLMTHAEFLINQETNDCPDMFLFPDAAVFPSEMHSVNNYIFELILRSDLTPRFLDENEIKYLNSMDSEKYRKNVT